jgi:putative SOS response-associated peptidase YedK
LAAEVNSPAARPEKHAAWLDPDTPQDELRSMLTAYPAGEMVGWEVNREYVCDPKRDGPECLEPAA